MKIARFLCEFFHDANVVLIGGREISEEVKETVARTSDCSICPDATLPDLNTFRTHFKTDWHVYNLRAKNNNETMLNEEEFKEVSLKNLEVVSEEDESSSDDEDQESIPGSPFILFKISKDGPTYCIYKTIVLSRCELSDRSFNVVSNVDNLGFRLSKLIPSKWAIVLIRSGRVTAGIFENTEGRLLFSKTFKRYTTRRKQGGSQLSRDSANGGKIRSAGAAIRRMNEVHLIEDVQGLLKQWSGHLSECTLIFWNPTTAGRLCLFTESHNGFSPDDPRLRTLPFTTYKPSLEELNRCYNLLSQVSTV
jgi:hypothetical protein